MLLKNLQEEYVAVANQQVGASSDFSQVYHRQLKLYIV
jgi:hypothetical protein